MERPSMSSTVFLLPPSVLTARSVSQEWRWARIVGSIAGEVGIPDSSTGGRAEADQPWRESWRKWQRGEFSSEGEASSWVVGGVSPWSLMAAAVAAYGVARWITRDVPSRLWLWRQTDRQAVTLLASHWLEGSLLASHWLLATCDTLVELPWNWDVDCSISSTCFQKCE